MQRVAVLVVLLIAELVCACEYAIYGSDHSMCKFPRPACKTMRRGLTQNDQNGLMQAHNKMRQKVANGQQSGQPQANNMKQLHWDNELAMIAQSLADMCVMRHDKNRRSHQYKVVGQNIWEGEGFAPDPQDIRQAVYDWFNEVKDFSSQNISPFKIVFLAAHYTQVVWAETVSVGCGFTSYPKGGNKYAHLVVCNYGPGGNMPGTDMYKVGRPCTNCDCSNQYPGLCYR